MPLSLVSSWAKFWHGSVEDTHFCNVPQSQQTASKVWRLWLFATRMRRSRRFLSWADHSDSKRSAIARWALGIANSPSSLGFFHATSATASARALPPSSITR
jgi:hypothetical protein